MFNKVVTTFAFLLCSMASASSLANSGTIGTYNLIVKNDANTKNEIGGKSFVGGNLTTSTTQMGFALKNDHNPNVDAVTVVHNVNNNGDLHIENGTNLVYGGNLSNSSKIINNGGGSVTKGNESQLQQQSDSLYSQVIAESEYYSKLDQTGSYSLREGKIIKLTASTSGLTVINIDSSLLANSNAEISFSNIPSSPVIINVTGDSDITIRAKAVGNLAGDDLASLIAWNFIDATKITLAGDGWVGSILAPYADVYGGNNGHIEGAVAALSYTGSIELHNSLFAYTPPETDTSTPVPAPSSLLLMALALLWIVIPKSLGYKSHLSKNHGLNDWSLS